jgi:hypothetical protein
VPLRFQKLAHNTPLLQNRVQSGVCLLWVCVFEAKHSAPIYRMYIIICQRARVFHIIRNRSVDMKMESNLRQAERDNDFAMKTIASAVGYTARTESELAFNLIWPPLLLMPACVIIIAKSVLHSAMRWIKLNGRARSCISLQKWNYICGINVCVCVCRIMTRRQSHLMPLFAFCEFKRYADLRRAMTITAPSKCKHLGSRLRVRRN